MRSARPLGQCFSSAPSIFNPLGHTPLIAARHATIFNLVAGLRDAPSSVKTDGKKNDAKSDAFKSQNTTQHPTAPDRIGSRPSSAPTRLTALLQRLAIETTHAILGRTDNHGAAARARRSEEWVRIAHKQDPACLLRANADSKANPRTHQGPLGTGSRSDKSVLRKAPITRSASPSFAKSRHGLNVKSRHGRRPSTRWLRAFSSCAKHFHSVV